MAVVQSVLQSSFDKPSAYPVQGVGTHLEEVGRIQVGVSSAVFVHRQQDAGMCQLARRCTTSIQQLFQRGPLLVIQVHDVFQLHTSPYSILLT